MGFSIAKEEVGKLRTKEAAALALMAAAAGYLIAKKPSYLMTVLKIVMSTPQEAVKPRSGYPKSVEGLRVKGEGER